MYNGKEEHLDYQQLRLSTAFKDSAGLKLTASTDLPLELVVQIYNINYGRNREILEKCKTLHNYSFFMGKISEYNKYLSLEESVEAAVKYCI